MNIIKIQSDNFVDITIEKKYKNNKYNTGLDFCAIIYDELVNARESLLGFKSEVETVLLDGKVKTFHNPVGKGSSRLITYIENLTMIIKTTKGEFIVYPDTKLKQVKGFWIDDYTDLLKQEILFYKTYFGNFYINFDSEGTDILAKFESYVTAYELETGNPTKSKDYLNIILNITLVIVFIYFILAMKFL